MASGIVGTPESSYNKRAIKANDSLWNTLSYGEPAEAFR